MKLDHVLSVSQFFDTSILEQLFSRVAYLEQADKGNYLEPTLKGKMLATLFYEPSTRTRFSFESAMQKLGGNVITTESAGMFSSAIKGESLEDTIKITSGYADAIVLRHPELGSAARAAAVSEVPVINAGDGPGEHPTQALLDLYTIKKELGRIEGLKVAMVGDLRYGRTVHSLLQLLALFPQVSMYFVSPEVIGLPEKYSTYLKEKGVQFNHLQEFDSILGEIDVMYVTRIQKERFASQDDYNSVKDAFVITSKTLEKMKSNSIVMHPLPRVGEILPEVDSDNTRAAYFRQAKNGLYVRMALLELLMQSRQT
ncbi:MAG: aspartate carbamoyltransferase [Candidatus Micrarchaeota archaeon]|nr:aspartate carbamoyltransferase [Candidatus Micrarchaeota archaeon]